MMRNWFFQIRILMFAAVMLLARPYVVYQIAGNTLAGRNPARAWSMLQRLVQKKDEHHDVEAGMPAMENAGRVAVRFLRPMLTSLAFFLLIFLRSDAPVFAGFDAYMLPARRHRHSLLSCWLI